MGRGTEGRADGGLTGERTEGRTDTPGVIDDNVFHRYTQFCLYYYSVFCVGLNKSVADVVVTSSSQRLPWRVYDDKKSVDGMYAYGQDVCKDVDKTEGRNPC